MSYCYPKIGDKIAVSSSGQIANNNLVSGVCCKNLPFYFLFVSVFSFCEKTYLLCCKLCLNLSQSDYFITK